MERFLHRKLCFFEPPSGGIALFAGSHPAKKVLL
jgi:hypothetical protein